MAAGSPPVDILPNLPSLFLPAPRLASCSLRELASPVCQTGGFRCLCCTPECSLLCSPAAAYNHVRTAARKAEKAYPTLLEWELLFEWLRRELTHAGVPWHDYLHWPSDLLAKEQYRHPSIAGRSLKTGHVCERCGSCFTRRGDAVRHQASVHGLAESGGIYKSKVMALTPNDSVPVDSDFAQRFSREEQNRLSLQQSLYEKAIEHALSHTEQQQQQQQRGTSGSITLTDAAIFGSSDISDGGSDLRPVFLKVFGWFAGFQESDKDVLLALTARTQKTTEGSSPAERLEGRVHSAVVTYFVETVARCAAAAPMYLSNLINHTFQLGGGIARLKEFHACNSETRSKYAHVIADAVVFAMRYYALPGVTELHSWAPASRPGTSIEANFATLKALFSQEHDDATASLGTEVEHIKAIGSAISDVFWGLLAQAAGLDPKLQAAERQSLHPALRYSTGSPLLVCFVCCSLLRRTNGGAGVTYAGPDFCRKLSVALMYGIKSYVLYRLAIRGEAGSALPEPYYDATHPALDETLRTVLLGLLSSLPLVHAGSIHGDGPGSALLLHLCGVNTTFQLLVTIAAKARAEDDLAKLQPQSFRAMQSEFHAYAYNGKVIFNESIHLSRKHAIDALRIELEQLLRGAMTVAGATDFSPLVTDNGDRRQPTLFGGSKLATQLLAAAANRQAEHRLRKLVSKVAVAIFFDVEIGPRASEYLPLLATPTAGVERTVEIDAEGLVMLHVCSEKNGLRDIAYLSAELSSLVIRYLAYFRPMCADTLCENDSQKSYLLPGLCSDTFRSHITAHFGEINNACMRSRVHRGFQAISATSLSNIGPRILRQYMHLLMNEIAVPDFASQLESTVLMMQNSRGSATADLERSPAFRLFMNVSLLPHLQGKLALHSVRTATSNYGRLEGLPDLTVRQISATRDFVRALCQQRADKAMSALGTDALSTLKWLDSSEPTAVLPLSERETGMNPSKRHRSNPPVGLASLAAPTEPQVLSSTTLNASVPTGAWAIEDGAISSEAVATLRPPTGLPSSATDAIATASAAVLGRSSAELVGSRAQNAILAVENALSLRFKPRPYFSNGQRQLVHMSSCGVDVLGILPTGSGKTLSLIGPALAFPDQVSLVVLPLVALQQDMYGRLCDAFHGGDYAQQCVLWFHAGCSALDLGQKYAPTVRIIIASVEALYSSQLELFLRALSACNPVRHLVRVFADEVHLLLPSASFRSAFQNVGLKLRSFGVPLVCTSATVGSAMETAIKRHIFDRCDVQVVREPCYRLNILYSVERCISANPIAEFADIVDKVLADPMWGTRQVVIFARTYLVCDALRSALRQKFPDYDVGVFNSDPSVSIQERLKALDAFKNGDSKLLIATEAFSSGVDISTIGSVLHYGVPASVETFHQQTGRAARLRSSAGSDRGVPLIGLSKLVYVEEEFQALRAAVSANSEASRLAEELGLPPPLQAAADMYQYVMLPGASACRRAWLAAKLGDTVADCLALKALNHGQTADLACCDLCVGRSSRFAQQSALQAASDIHQLERFEKALLQAEELFSNNRYCPSCSFFHGKLVEFGKRPACAHRMLAHLDRCYQCAAFLKPPKWSHPASQCKVLSDLLPKEKGPSSRCFKCLRLMNQHPDTPCNQGTKRNQPYTLFLAALAITSTRPRSPDQGSPVLQLVMARTPLGDPITGALAAAAKANVDTPEGRQALCRELLQDVNAGRAGYCHAHEILVRVARGLGIEP